MKDAFGGLGFVFPVHQNEVFDKDWQGVANNKPVAAKWQGQLRMVKVIRTDRAGPLLDSFS